jgi:hypothetical protein
VRVLFGLPLFFIDTHKFFSLASVLAKAVVTDTIKPCRKLRFTAKAPDIFVGADEGLLGKIVGQSDVASGELAQQAPDARLVAADQLAISVLVLVNKNSSNERCIC